jgi:hypothetical protein
VALKDEIEEQATRIVAGVYEYIFKREANIRAALESAEYNSTREVLARAADRDQEHADWYRVHRETVILFERACFASTLRACREFSTRVQHDRRTGRTTK